MSRLFSRAAGDFIQFSPGNAATLTGGGQTTVFLWKADTATAHGLMIARNAGGSNVFGVNPYSDTFIYYTAASFVATTAYGTGTWYLTAITKATGSSAVRVHTYDYTAATWTHTNYGAINDSTAGPVNNLRLGWLSGTDILNGKLAASALYNTVLTDLQIQGMNTTLGSWLALSPVWCVALNQASVATPVNDLTAGGGNQTSISGTAVSADEPAGWSYSTEIDLTATLTGTSGLTAPLSNEVHLAATLTGTGGLTAALAPEVHLDATLTGTGGLTVTTVTPTGPPDPIGTPVAQQLLTCLTTQLAQLPRPPKYTQLRVGAETGPLIGENVDECCAGLAWVRIASIYPSWDSFPSPDNTWLPCGPLAYAVVLEMGVAFCMPWSDSDDSFENRDPPNTTDWSNAFTTQMQHQTLMRRAAACCWHPTQRRAVGEWNPLSVEGGCTGGTLRVTVSVPAPCADC